MGNRKGMRSVKTSLKPPGMAVSRVPCGYEEFWPVACPVQMLQEKDDWRQRIKA